MDRPLCDTFDPAVRTLMECLEFAARKFRTRRRARRARTRDAAALAERPCLGRRRTVDGAAGPYQWSSYADTFERVRCLA